MVSLSHTLKKSHFLTLERFLGFSALPKSHFFAVRTLLKISLLFEKKIKKLKIFWNFLEKLLSYPETYFGRPGTFWSLRNHIFRKKSRKKSLTQVTPPGEVSTGLSRGWGGVGGRDNQNVGHQIKTLKYFFKHPIKNILTI